MLGRWWRGDGVERLAVSADFDHALTREVLRTELVRIKSLIATALVLLVVLWAVDSIAPEGLDNIWQAGSARSTSMSSCCRSSCSSSGSTGISAGI